MIGVSHIKGHIDHPRPTVFGDRMNTPPPVGSPMYFANIGEGLYPYLIYIGTLSFAYIAYRAGKVVYNQLR